MSERREIAPGVFFVTRDWLSANQVIALSPQLVMIDTGFSGDLAETFGIIRALGRGPEEVELIVNSHCHCDHCGGNAAIRHLSSCQIWLHEGEKRRLEEGDDIGTWWRFHDTWADPFPVDRGLREGDLLEIGPLTLQVMDAPGHSSGQMMFYCRELKALFSSDALWHGDMGVINTVVEGDDALDRAVETLERISALQLETIYPGHGPVIANPVPVLKRVMTKLERYRSSPELMHMDHLRKMVAYIILTKGSVPADGFLAYLQDTVWFRTMVDRYFGGRYEETYRSTMEGALRNRMIETSGGHYHGTGKN